MSKKAELHYNGTIYDAIEVMKMVESIYKSDNKWMKKFLK